MPQIDLSIINLTIFAVFSIFTISLFSNILFKKLSINKVFFFFNTFTVFNKNKLQLINIKKYF